MPNPSFPSTTNISPTNLPSGLISTLSPLTNRTQISPTAPNKLSYNLPSWLPLTSSASLASANNIPQAQHKLPDSHSNSAKTPFLTGVNPPTNDNASTQSQPFLKNTTTTSSKPISLRAHLEAAISNPSSPSAQANLLRHLQSTLAAIRPSSSSQAAATTNSSASTSSPQQPTFALVPSITPAAVASALAATAGRCHTLSSTPAAASTPTNVTNITSAQQTQRLEQIRYYQQLIAQLNATMPANTAAAAATLPFEASRYTDSVKTDLASGFNAAAFGLNPMSADDPSWIGHGFQAQATEDFLSSPEWTDPSPALTDSMSFEIDSCGPSPLLPLDSYEDDLGVPGIAGAPLFPPMDGYASSNVSPLELSNNDFGASNTVGDFGAPEMGSDFSLFPETASAHNPAKAVKLPVEMAFSKLSKPGAGSSAASSTEDPAITLLRALSSAALSNSAAATASVAVPTTTSATSAPALTASPLAFTTSSAPPTLAPAPASTPVATADESKSSSAAAMERRTSSSSSSTKTDSTSRGTKRRLDTTELLPLDAPIQKRTYYAVSATSRRDTNATDVDEFAEEEAAIRREKDPRVAKRLSNTLAARRSRHRKTEELRLLHEKIEALTGEVESWKRRCELAEKERDDARALVA